MSQTIHILYEHDAWLPPLLEALDQRGLQHTSIHVAAGHLDPQAQPAPGVYLNRMSPSSHTRGHDTSCDLMHEWLYWLESHGRPVINGSAAFALETSKFRQDRVLQRYGIRSPRTLLAVGADAILDAAATFTTPFLLKHNCSGKGLGILKCDSAEEARQHIAQHDFDFGPKGQMILQEYIEPAEPFITRVEIVDGEFVLAMRSDTTDGFELCPADVCQIPSTPDVCPVDGGSKFGPSPLTADDSLVQQYIEMCTGEGIDIAGIEFVETADGTRYTYDINCTTNYNQAFGESIGVRGMDAVAQLCVKRLGLS